MPEPVRFAAAAKGLRTSYVCGHDAAGQTGAVHQVGLDAGIVLRHGVSAVLAWGCSGGEGDVLAIGGGVDDHHFRARHAGASSNGRPAVLDWTLDLKEDISALRLCRCIGDVQLVAEIGLGRKALSAYRGVGRVCDGD